MTNKPHLDGEEEKQAEEFQNVPSSVIFAAIRREGSTSFPGASGRFGGRASQWALPYARR